MGLDTTHNCWHGSYTSFHRWRVKVAEVAGYGALDEYQGFGGSKPWPNDNPLTALLGHSDCDGEIAAKDCTPLADALERLLPLLSPEAGDDDRTRQFINGLRAAAAAGEAVEFH